MTPAPAIFHTPHGPVECAVTGEGPAVLLLHGAMGGYDQSHLLGLSALGSSRYQFLAVSRPGYLGTPLASGAAPEQQADLCAGLLDALNIRQAAVIAISGGGQCALQFALRHPTRCRALVMISACSSPITKRPPLRFHLFMLMARIPALTSAIRRKTLENPEKVAGRSISDPATLARTLADPEIRPLMFALQASTMDRLSQRMSGTQNDVYHSRQPFNYPLECITTPTLVVHGTADQAAPHAHSKSLAARVPNAELLNLEGGEHVSLFTHLHEIRARVAQFLQTHWPPAPES